MLVHDISCPSNRCLVHAFGARHERAPNFFSPGQMKLTLINLLLWSLSLRTLDPQGSFALSLMAEAATKKEKHF